MTVSVISISSLDLCDSINTFWAFATCRVLYHMLDGKIGPILLMEKWHYLFTSLLTLVFLSVKQG